MAYVYSHIRFKRKTYKQETQNNINPKKAVERKIFKLFPYNQVSIRKCLRLAGNEPEISVQRAIFPPRIQLPRPTLRKQFARQSTMTSAVCPFRYNSVAVRTAVRVSAAGAMRSGDIKVIIQPKQPSLMAPTCQREMAQAIHCFGSMFLKVPNMTALVGLINTYNSLYIQI